MDKNEIIDRISYLRARANLTARSLSMKIGKNEGYINRLEAKKDFLPTLETLFDILDELGSNTEEFFYYNIKQYDIDRELMTLLSVTSETKKRAVIELLSNR